MCPKCCFRSSCRGKTSKLLENLDVSRGRSKNNTDFEGGLYLPFQDPATSYKIPNSHKLLCQSSQEQLPVRGITSAYRQECGGISSQSNFPRVFQPTFSGSQTKQQMETDLRSEQTESFPKNGEIQDGNTRDHQNLPPTRRVGNLSRLQGCLLPYSNTGTVQEISQISCPGSDIPVQSSALWSLHSPYGVHCDSKGGKTDGHSQGYKNPPVPRRLVGQSYIPSNLYKTHPDPGQNVPGFGLVGELGKVRTGTQTSLRLRRLPVRPQVRSGQTYTGPLGKSPRKDTRVVSTSDLSGPAVHVPDRTIDSHREASSPRSVTHETNSVAPQKQLESTGIVRKVHSGSKITPPTLKMVTRRKQCSTRSTITPYKTCPANLYRRIKRRVGRSLKRAHCKRVLVGAREQIAHKLPGTQSSFSSLKRVPKLLYRSNGFGSNGQHYSSGLHKQGRRHEVGSPLCPTLENIDLVLPKTSNTEGPAHTRPPQCDSGQTIQARSNHTDRVVPPSRDFSQSMQEVAPSSDRLVCHEVQSQTASVCVSSSGPLGSSSGCTHSTLGGSGCLRLPTDRHIGQSGGETTGFSLQKTHSHCPGLAQHALVLGLGDHVQSSPSQPSKSAQLADSALQSDPSQKSHQPKSPCMAPRATKIKEQGFSEAVAARIEAPQRRSTRSVYEAKWTIFTKWCNTNQVDFRSPPVKSIADFLLYLFQDRKLQPSTIDGYRSAIADKLGNAVVNVSKDDNLTRLLESFHRDRPKGRRGIPSWNLSLVLHQLTKAPFEPLKEATLKHLTFKTVFLLALGSGKRRSEIHAWQHKNIRHQSDWSKVSLFPSPSFLSKNQLAKEGPGSVAPVVIPALAPTVDRSLKSDRSLCPIRALRYYLDRTSDLRQHKELVFVSFKKGFDRDISPATISSWVKQTVILCYELSDQQSHTLHQVKAHDVRAFAASKAFQSGVSLEQILSACHWKSHNTFTQFYLKDVAWADSELYHLGPVVVAQQIHQESRT